jgi:hypothetical protein
MEMEDPPDFISCACKFEADTFALDALGSLADLLEAEHMMALY